jgi:hypothetical protein
VRRSWLIPVVVAALVTLSAPESSPAATQSGHVCAANGICATYTLYAQFDPALAAFDPQGNPANVIAHVVFDQQEPMAADTTVGAWNELLAELKSADLFAGQRIDLHIGTFVHAADGTLEPTGVLGCGSGTLASDFTSYPSDWVIGDETAKACTGANFTLDYVITKPVVIPRDRKASRGNWNPLNAPIPWPVKPGYQRGWFSLTAPTGAVSTSDSFPIYQPFTPPKLTAERISPQEVRLTARSPLLADCLPNAPNGVPHTRNVVVTGARYRRGRYGPMVGVLAGSDFMVSKQITCGGAASATLLLHLNHPGKWRFDVTITSGSGPVVEGLTTITTR